LLPTPAPVFLYSQIAVPEFATIEDAESFLLNLSQREATGELESASVQTVTERVRAWIQSKRAGQDLDIKRLNAGHETGEQIIRITGGLPMIPGCENLIMPNQLNGRDTQLLDASNGHALPGPTIDSVAVPDPEAEPHTPASGQNIPANFVADGANSQPDPVNAFDGQPAQTNPTTPGQPCVSAFAGKTAQGSEAPEPTPGSPEP
jgi:hypothetical protein